MNYRHAVGFLEENPTTPGCGLEITHFFWRQNTLALENQGRNNNFHAHASGNNSPKTAVAADAFPGRSLRRRANRDESRPGKAMKPVCPSLSQHGRLHSCQGFAAQCRQAMRLVPPRDSSGATTYWVWRTWNACGTDASSVPPLHRSTPLDPVREGTDEASVLLTLDTDRHRSTARKDRGTSRARATAFTCPSTVNRRL